LSRQQLEARAVHSTGIPAGQRKTFALPARQTLCSFSGNLRLRQKWQALSSNVWSRQQEPGKQWRLLKKARASGAITDCCPNIHISIALLSCAMEFRELCSDQKPLNLRAALSGWVTCLRPPRRPRTNKFHILVPQQFNGFETERNELSAEFKPKRWIVVRGNLPFPRILAHVTTNESH